MITTLFTSWLSCQSLSRSIELGFNSFRRHPLPLLQSFWSWFEVKDPKPSYAIPAFHILLLIPLRVRTSRALMLSNLAHMCSHSSQPTVHMHWHKSEARDIRSTSNRQKGSITKLLSPCIAYVHQQHHWACMHNLTIRWPQDTQSSLKWVRQDRRITTLTWFSCWWTTHIFFKSQRFLRALQWHSNSKE